MKVTFDSKTITEKDYNFIVSNLILSQKCKFTYYDILTQVQKMFGFIDKELKSVTEKALIRLRDDGFLDILGSRYWVLNL